MRSEKVNEENILLFLKNIRKTESVFRQWIRKDSQNSVLIAENESRLLCAVSESVRAFRGVRFLPVCGDGVPRLYRFAEGFLQKNTEQIQEKMVKTALTKEENGMGGFYYDEELFLLPRFLILAGAALCVKEKNEKYLQNILSLCEMDFSDIFFSFSKIEKIFLSEAVGIYAVSDIRTKYLYHKRLASYAYEKGADPVTTAKRIVAAANEKNTHIGAILPKPKESGALYFSFLILMTAVLMSVFLLMNGAGLWNILLTMQRFQDFCLIHFHWGL